MVLVVTRVVQADGQVIVNTSSTSCLDSGANGVERPSRHSRRDGDVRVLTHDALGSLLLPFDDRPRAATGTARERASKPREEDNYQEEEGGDAGKARESVDKIEETPVVSWIGMQPDSPRANS